MRKALFIICSVISGYVSAAPLACLIEPEKVAEIGAPGVGVIEKISVERGDSVKAGQVIAYLKADVERASVGVASVRAQADAEVQAASSAYQLARVKLSRSRDLLSVGFVSKEAVDQAEIETKIAYNRVLQAREAQSVSKRELELSHSQLAQRSIRAPFAGIIVDRYRTEGERVEREPIVRVAKVDPLRVEVILPAAQFGQIKLGTPVMIKTDIAGAKELSAKVALIDRIIDAASNTFRVRLTLPNPDHSIPAGLRCTADFGPADPLSNQAKSGKAAALDRMGGGVVRAAHGGRLSYQLQSVPQRQ